MGVMRNRNTDGSLGKHIYHLRQRHAFHGFI
jgi:hypothetical protein